LPHRPTEISKAVSAYISIIFPLLEQSKNDIVVAGLIDIGFEGFEEADENLIAFIPSQKFSDSDFSMFVSKVGEMFSLTFQKKEIQEENWNETWEKNFQPIIVGNDIAVRASFHSSFRNVKYEIVIDPKMSFGTGHHATTAMMMQLMLTEDLEGKSVLDFGCGTGILAILAAKLGANQVKAIDNDPWAIENATENLLLNHANNAEVIRSEIRHLGARKFEVILANISRDVIIENTHEIADRLCDNGTLIISGFLKEHQQKIVPALQNRGFEINHEMNNDEWIAISLRKNISGK
jgi:ribosomal protein L11 methyltransferase